MTERERAARILVVKLDDLCRLVARLLDGS